MFFEIITTRPHGPFRADDHARRRFKIEVAGILRVLGIGNKHQRPHWPAGRAGYRQHALEIDAGDLFAPPEISQNLLARFLYDPVQPAVTPATRRQAKDQARPRRRAPIDDGFDAERPVIPLEPGRARFRDLETRRPEQRAIGEKSRNRRPTRR